MMQIIYTNGCMLCTFTKLYLIALHLKHKKHAERLASKNTHEHIYKALIDIPTGCMLHALFDISHTSPFGFNAQRHLSVQHDRQLLCKENNDGAGWTTFHRLSVLSALRAINVVVPQHSISFRFQVNLTVPVFQRPVLLLASYRCDVSAYELNEV